MEQENRESELPKYDKKSWGKSAILGFLIGLAVIVPGISGSTVAIIFKLYDQFLYAVGNLFKKFKRCFFFLLPIGIGLVLGVLLGFISVKQLVALLPFSIVCLFAGLMCGAFPAVKDEIQDAAHTPKRMILFGVGLFLPVAVGCLSAWLTVGGEVGGDVFASVQWWQVLLGVVIGYAFGITQIVPGLSGSALLMAVGWFQSLMSSISLTYWKSNPEVFLVYIGLGVGVLLGIFTFSKFLTYVFGKARQTAYHLIVGLSLGSILSMFCNGDMMETYLLWAQQGVNLFDIFLGVCLFAVGIVGSYLLVRYQRKKDAESVQNAVDPTQV
ncbi:MAG: DUF368 domain-containing protein [Clostridia bacterium]|nr:DUF368 domain-containing protein [Clostridia bacterium]